MEVQTNFECQDELQANKPFKISKDYVSSSSDPVIDICCGYENSGFVTKSGKVYSWGQNYDFQVIEFDWFHPLLPVGQEIEFEEDSEKVVKLEFTEQASFALSNLGKLYYKGFFHLDDDNKSSIAKAQKTWKYLPIIVGEKELAVKELFTGKNTLIVLTTDGKTLLSGEIIADGLPLEYRVNNWSEIMLQNVASVQISCDFGLMTISQQINSDNC